MTSTIANPGQPAAALAWPEFPIGLGTGRLCSLDGGLSVTRAERLLACAFDLGVRFVDTAPSYGQGHAETAIGRLAPAARAQLTICSKVGYSFGGKARWINAAKPLVRPVLPWVTALRRSLVQARQQAALSGRLSLVIEPTAIRASLEGSLRRLRRDYLDVLLLHDPSIESVANQANQDELRELVRCGKIRAWGVSTHAPSVAAQACEAPGCAVIQVPVYPQWVADNPRVLPQCAASQVSVIAHSVLSPMASRSSGAEAAPPAASARQCIAFALRQPAVRVVLCGTRNLNHLRSNVADVRAVMCSE